MTSDDLTTPAERNEFARQRKRMVDMQLRSRGFGNQRVLAAMASVPREEFVRPKDIELAYANCPLPINYGQTISQPFTVAWMCEMVCPRPQDRVLEIGTGSGYGAAVLSLLSQHVDTVECVTELAHSAARRLQWLGYDNVTVHIADGSEGLPAEAPYDVIITTAATIALPKPFAEQLTDGGRIIIPLGAAASGQTLTLFTRKGRELISKDCGEFSFVPLVGKHGLDSRSPPGR